MPPPKFAQKELLELKKHVGLIHSTNKLTLLERKIANALLYNAYVGLLTKKEHKIHLADLCDLISYNSKDYRTIRQSLVGLISTVLEWNLVDNNEKKDQPQDVWVASSMLSDAKIDGPVCTYSYSNRMCELCYFPEFYGRLHMQVLSRFKSTYGLALYENCIRYQDLDKTPWFDLPTYRKLMGIADGKYEVFRDLNRRVLRPSIAEVNKYSPIIIDPEFRKRGRGVVDIRFHITQKDKSSTGPRLRKKKLGGYAVFQRLTQSFGVSLRKAEEFMSRYSEPYLLEKMQLIEKSSSYAQGKIENLAKYLEKALINDYQPPKSSKENLEKLHARREEDAKIRQQREAHLERYRCYQNKNLPAVLANLPDEKRRHIQQEFDLYIQATVYYSVYLRNGFDNPLVLDRLGDFVRERHSELLSLLQPFEVFSRELQHER